MSKLNFFLEKCQDACIFIALKQSNIALMWKSCIALHSNTDLLFISKATTYCLIMIKLNLDIHTACGCTHINHNFLFPVCKHRFCVIIT